VRKLWAAGTLTHSPHVRSGRLKPGVDFYIPLFIQLHACHVEPDALSVRCSASSDKNVGTLDDYVAVRVVALHSDLAAGTPIDLADSVEPFAA